MNAVTPYAKLERLGAPPTTLGKSGALDLEHLDVLLASIWSDLAAGAQRSAAPFHLGVLATVGADGPSLRTVVLRAVSPRERLVLCHTDGRARKIAEVSADGRLAWLFYDAEAKVQLRLSGSGTVHTDDALANLQWGRTSVSARRCYRVPERSGTPVNNASSGLPPAFQHRSPTAVESESGRENFAVISCEVENIDWLHLRARGHQRARFRWSRAGWEKAWLVP